jgi:ubiquinone/menaquinone biosynthesis C-methylase UbiE
MKLPSRINADEKVVEDFGAEWSQFSQAELTGEDRRAMFDSYFDIFGWDKLPANAVGADIGCGSGRWAVLTAPRVGRLHCVDASDAALDVARRNLHDRTNVEFHHASVGKLPFTDGSLDFAYSLGVLHHVPDTAEALKNVARILKRGAPLLLYLYYAFDNRPFLFKVLWRLSDCCRLLISRLSGPLKRGVCEVIAAVVYWPIARLGMLLDRANWMPAVWPLSYYRDRSFYVMRTDSLDRFGTRLEHRFNRNEIADMMTRAGLTNIRFSEKAPYWCAIGYKQ